MKDKGKPIFKKPGKLPYHVAALREANKHRDFPHNTCPASRHVQLIAEILAKKKPYPMLHEDPEHCAGSMLSTVAALFRVRTELRALKLELRKAKRLARFEIINDGHRRWVLVDHESLDPISFVYPSRKAAQAAARAY